MEGFNIENQYYDDDIIFCYYAQSHKVCNGECGLKCQVYKDWLELNKRYFKNIIEGWVGYEFIWW